MSRTKRIIGAATAVPLAAGLSLAIGVGAASASASPNASCAAATAVQTSTYVTFQAHFHSRTPYPVIADTAPGAHCSL